MAYTFSDCSQEKQGTVAKSWTNNQIQIINLRCLFTMNTNSRIQIRILWIGFAVLALMDNTSFAHSGKFGIHCNTPTALDADPIKPTNFNKAKCR